MPIDTSALLELEESAKIAQPNRTSHDGIYFIKRSLHRGEWKTSEFSGKELEPRLGLERIRNEEATIQFLKAKTTVPVPNFIASFTDNDVVYLVTEYIDGVTMDKLNEAQRASVADDVLCCLEQLNELTSDTFGGPTGLVVPPPPFITDYKTLEMKRADKADELVFCHGDISPNRIIVNPLTLEILAITGWEFAGFYPRGFATPRLGPASTADVSDAELKVKREKFEAYWIPDKHIPISGSP